MPKYDYECPTHGRVEIIKSADDASRLECCRVEVPVTVETGPDFYQRLFHHKAWQCALPMKRLYSAQGIIVRPSGYNRRPGDKDWDNFDREIELGEVRDPGKKAESGGVKVSVPRPKIDTSTASIAAERNLRQAVAASIVEV